MLHYLPQFKQYWKQFQVHYSIDATIAQHIYRQLEQAYAAPQRHYHGLQHIVECLDLFHQVKTQLADPFAVELALWFHDVIYDAQASDNEEQSAIYMQQSCADMLSAAQAQKIADWIKATKRHAPSSDLDLNILLDIDLAILGSSVQRFAEYQQQIREEYHWVEAKTYVLKRAAVLDYFYQMQPLYQTAYFQKYFEANAKHNLALALGEAF